MDAGKLRYRIDIEQRVVVQDSLGDPKNKWEVWAPKVPAAREPLTSREFLNSNQTMNKVTVRWIIRWRPGVEVTMRIKHGSDIYNIEGLLPDAETGRDHILILASKGTNQG